jgi:hypothetical protein
MAQMFSSGVTPDYLKALADAYAQYFPQQVPVNTQALQQWYSPNGSSAFAAPMGSSEAPSVVGSLFGEQYPQTRDSGTRGVGEDSNPQWSGMSDAQKANFYANNPGWGTLNQGLQSLFGNTSLGMLQNKFAPEFVQNQKLISMGITPNPTGTLADMGVYNAVVDPMQAAQAQAILNSFENSSTKNTGTTNNLGVAGVDGVGRTLGGAGLD